MIKKLSKWLLLSLIVLVAAAMAVVWYIGAWNLVFPNRSHDTHPPNIARGFNHPAILIFSKTNGFRHREGIEGGKKALEAIAAENAWFTYHTENGAVFNTEQLSQFDAVVFLNASGDMLSESQEEAFKTWLIGGGGWLGIHAAGDDSHSEWGWYVDNLIGAKFVAHIMGPQFQEAKVVTETPSHPAGADLPTTWRHTEEWYSWKSSPREKGFEIIASIDEASYNPYMAAFGQNIDLRMGDHPVVWSNCVGQGRSVYSALGHRAEAFEVKEHRAMLAGSLRWILALEGPDC